MFDPMPIKHGMTAHSITSDRVPEHPVRRARGPREHGFTMIELVVGMVLLGIVAAMIIRGVTDGFGGYQDAKAQSDGMAQAAEAADRFGTDLRVARSAGRSGPIISPSELQDAIDTNGDVTDIATGQPLDWRDITKATGSEIVFQADVIDEAGVGARPECVRWYVATSGGWSLRRQVRSYTPQCGGSGTLLEDDAMTSPNSSTPAPGAGGSPNLFTYVTSNTAGTNCSSSALASAPTAIQRNRVVSVRINFTSLATQRDASANAALLDEISIRSRTASDYQFGLRCGA